MKGIVRRRDRARQDLIDIFRYLACQTGVRTASRFFNQRKKRPGSKLVCLVI